jgi:hypothetical protein
LIYFNLPTLIKIGDFNMLKFERLGHGSLINDKCRFGALVDEVSDVKVTMVLDGVDDMSDEDAKAPECSFKIRHVGTGTVLEGHRSLVVPEPEAEGDEPAAQITIDPKVCKLTVKATLKRNVPKGKTKLDLSDVFKAGLTANDITVDGEPAGVEDADPIATVDNNKAIVTLATPAGDGGAEVAVNFVLAAGKATTNGNAAQVALKPGKYQVHFITVLHENVEDTNMPNKTMLEFIKHCNDVLPAVHA